MLDSRVCGEGPVLGTVALPFAGRRRARADSGEWLSIYTAAFIRVKIVCVLGPA